MRVELRPTQSTDFQYVAGEPLPFMVKGLTALIDGRVIGIGGLGFIPRGPIVAFVQMAPGEKRYAMALHRAAKRTLDDARSMGLQRVVAWAEEGIEPAPRYLTRLGFREEENDGKKVWVWRPNRKAGE